MGKLSLAVTESQAKKMRLSVRSHEPKGLFLWIGCCGVVDWTVGWHKKRGFECEKHYHGWSVWKALWVGLTHKDGFVTLTRFI